MRFALAAELLEAFTLEIQQAYFDRSRSFHPDLRHRPDLADCGKELSVVFERLKLANGVLSGVEFLKQVQMKTNPDSGYCQRVTANDGELGEQHLRDFQDNEKTIPTILTISRLKDGRCLLARSTNNWTLS